MPIALIYDSHEISLVRSTKTFQILRQFKRILTFHVQQSHFPGLQIFANSFISPISENMYNFLKYTKFLAENIDKRDLVKMTRLKQKG